MFSVICCMFTAFPQTWSGTFMHQYWHKAFFFLNNFKNFIIYFINPKYILTFLIAFYKTKLGVKCWCLFNLPVPQIPDSDLGVQPHVVIRVPSTSDLSDPGVTLDQGDITHAMQLSENIDASQQGMLYRENWDMGRLCSHYFIRQMFLSNICSITSKILDYFFLSSF